GTSLPRYRSISNIGLVGTGFMERSEHGNLDHPGAIWMVAAHSGRLWIFDLSAHFQTPAHHVGFPQHLFCPTDTPRSDAKYARNNERSKIDAGVHRGRSQR